MAIEISSVTGTGHFSATRPRDYSSLEIPMDVEDGDLGLIVVTTDNRTVTTPSGWTRIAGANGYAFFQKELTESMRGETLTITIQHASAHAWMLTVVKGATLDVTSGVDVTPYGVPSVTPSSGDHLSVLLMADSGDEPTWGEWTIHGREVQASRSASVLSKQYSGGAGAPTGAETATVKKKAALRIALAPAVVDTPVDVTVDTPTATFDAYEPEVVIATPARMDVDTATASVNAYEPEVETQALPSLSVVVSRDQSTGQDPSVHYLHVSTSNEVALGFDIPAPVHANNWVSASLQVSLLGPAQEAGNVVVRQIVAEWEDGVYTYTLGDDSITAALPSEGDATIDVSSLIDPANFYGLHISGDGFIGYLRSRDTANTTNGPTLTVTYDPSIEPPVLIDVDTSIITADSYDVSVETTTGVTVDVDTSTVSAEAYDVDVFIREIVDVDTATLTTAVVEASVDTKRFNIVELTPTEDYVVTSSGAVENTSADRITASNSPRKRGVIKFAIPEGLTADGLTAESLVSAVFTYSSTSHTGVSRGGFQIISDWGTNEYNSVVAGGPLTAANGSYRTHDITSLIDVDNFAGLRLDITSTGSYTYSHYIYSSEAEDPALRPSLTLVYEVPPGVTLDVDTPSATAQAIEPTIEVQRSTEIILDALTASLDAYDVSVGEGSGTDVDTAILSTEAYEATVESVVSPDVTVDVDTATALVQAPEPTISLSTSVDVSSTDTVMLGAYEVDIELTQGARIEVSTPRIHWTHHQVTDVNGEPVLPQEDEDPYFVSTMRTLVGYAPGIGGGTQQDANDSLLSESTQEWFRFNERSGTTAYDRAYYLVDDGRKQGQDLLSLSNVVLGLNEGPEGRHHVHFNGDAFAKRSAGGNTYYEPVSLEFTLRTSRKTQYLMGGSGVKGNVLWVTHRPAWELWTIDGVLTYRALDWDGNITDHVIGFTDIADGRWHHVVFQKAHVGYQGTGGGRQATTFSTEVYVDGKLDIRRRSGPQPLGMPEFIGGMDGRSYETGRDRSRRSEEIAKSHWFLGDLTELVFRNGRVLSEDEITTQRDNVMAIRSVRPDSARLTIDAGEFSAQGNTPRVLVLDFSPGQETVEGRTGRVSKGSDAYEVYDRIRYINAGSPVAGMDFPGWGEPDVPNLGSSEDPSRFLRFPMSVRGFRDKVTDNHRLIDLEEDINMDDYDIISVVGFPRSARAREYYESGMDALNAPPMIPVVNQVETLLEQVRDQVVNNGKGLYLTDPFVSVALGVVDKVDFVPNFRESAWTDDRVGAVTGMLDWHSLLTDPFANPSGPRNPDGSYPFTEAGLKAASRYEDTHANVHQRVRVEIPGLTDLPGWIKTDEIRWYDVNAFAAVPYQISRRFEERPFGLQVGDEFYIDEEIRNNKTTSRFNSLNRSGGFASAPMNSIRVGQAVTTFSRTIRATTANSVNEAIDNPYKDHALSIVAQPGDVWDGEQISGKIYVNFSEKDVWWPEYERTGRIMQLRSRGFENGLGIGDVINQFGGRRLVVNANHLRYNYSTQYGNFAGSDISLPQTGGSGADWGWSPGGIRNPGPQTGARGGLAWASFFYSAVPQESIKTPTMANRAVRWLASDLDNDGNASVVLATADISTKAEEVQVTSVRNTEVSVGTARIQAESFPDAETIDPDVTVLVSTPSLRVGAHQPVEEMVMATATIQLQAHRLDYVADVNYSDALVLTLPRQIMTLTMEDS